MESWHILSPANTGQLEGSLGMGGEMKWAQRSSGGFLSLTQDHHRDMEGHQQGDGQAAWPVVKGPRWGFLTLLR